MQNTLHRNVYSVDALTEEIRKLLEMSYADIWVEGEVSSLSKPPSGHMYFTLKDRNSVLKCVMFKNRRYLAATLPVEGERFLLRGRVSVYTARGDVQLICSYIEAAGEGELRRRFEAMKKKLAAEGLFDEQNKQPIPKQPRTIALITSSHGAVLHDIISTLRRRYPMVTLKLFPVSVQGETSANEVTVALQTVVDSTADIVILARGGGSLEDLQAFNEESVARAVFTCPLPVISAIGHETDFVITDFVADLRAPTPTAAATLVTPDIREIRDSLSHTRQQLDKQMQYSLDKRQQQLDFSLQRLKHPRDRLSIQASKLNSLELRLVQAGRAPLENRQRNLQQLKSRLQLLAPGNRLETAGMRLDILRKQMHSLISARVNRERAQIERYQAALQAYSPTQTLARGYSILHTTQGQVVRAAEQVEKGDKLQARLHMGQLDLTVSGLRTKAD